MLRMVLALMLAVGMSGPVRAQEGPVQGVIASQIEAFGRDDFATAFTFASPMIKGIFGTPERFGMMVRQGYPMVWRPADVQYLEQRQAGPFTYQKVLIEDRQGAFFTLEYEMIQTPDGWQINGVQFLRDPPVAA
ncbi:MAG: DUF4864 domain-containing protein [Rhodobacter sp.]|nr:DUF4864 domain-containing protein [Rhodobacter sp.]